MILFTGLLVCWIAPTSASPTAVDHSNLQLRKAFINAEQLLSKKRLTAWRKLKPTLSEYPLYPYLVLKEVRAKPSSFESSEISRLVSELDIPIQNNFLSWWLGRLQSEKNWDLIVQHYSQATSSSTRCIYTLALLRTKQSIKAIPNIHSLWLSKRSQPKACDPLFEYGLKQGVIDDELIWKRLLVTKAANNLSLSKYLSNKLQSKESKRWVARLRKAHHHPRDNLRKHLPEWIQSSFGRDVIHHAFLRIAKRDLSESVQIWRELKIKYPSEFSKLAKTEKAIALKLAYNHHQDAYQWLSKLAHEFRDETVFGLMVRSALAAESWDEVLTTIESMPAEVATRSEWTFWRARALFETEDVETANQLWEKLAVEHNFYGFLAADRLQYDYSFPAAAIQMNSDEMAEITSKVPGFVRIREWLALNRPYSARRELQELKKIEDEHFWQAAATLFHTWGWHDGAIQASYRLDQSENLALNVFYPSPFIQQVRKESIRHGVPSHWIYGIMRQESHFVPDIRSSMGATGLMQLLPSTARHTAKRQGLKKPSTSQLTSPSMNIRLGVAYFKQLLDSMHGNPVHALAGYNAGPSRSKKWQNTIHVSDPVIWVETIPFTETRLYVRRILVNFIVYDRIHNQRIAKVRDYLKNPEIQRVSTN